MNRRKAILAVGGALATAMAGCTDDSDGGTGADGGGGEGGDGNGGGGGGEGSGGGGKITADAASLLPTIEDFEGTGWVQGGTETATETSTTTPRATNYASRVFQNDPTVLYFDVWKYESIDAAKTGFDEKIQSRTENRSVVEVDIADEGIAYEFGLAVVDFRDANVMGRVEHIAGDDGDVSVAESRAKMMHQMWR